MERETGKRPSQLDEGGDLPEALKHVFEWFLELSSARIEYRPITNAELFAFCWLRDIRLSAIELEALQVLDREWVLHKANSLKNKG